ncbi:hypothetical protein PHLCEN_2v12960 [Hermanssonia centrifuga]|uniref:Uncharacterized protein n=1 Tax=Hermanssonia centrifuga TaxID=98765 RepID=A0A2R6NFE5_9APHY|nr:hypothetical protein PHLCEN_2v12960 [Hermanssonia centrifuga]
MSSLFQPKLSFESTSPKPCIVPGNALQLIDDDPSASRSHTPSSIIIIDDDSHGHVEGSADSSNDHEPGRRPIPRVRFRSRVRITSGLRRSRHDQSAASASSSASGSPSSSISAPLRWQADEHGTWGPLGRRLNAYANSTGRGKRSSTAARVKQVEDGQQPQDSVKTNERTPLLRPGRRVAYVDPELDGGGDADDEGVTQTEAELDSEEEEERALREAALKREEDAVFGQWPWRIFNRHVRTPLCAAVLIRTDPSSQWWWWHAEPVLCCFGEDSEYEE